MERESNVNENVLKFKEDLTFVRDFLDNLPKQTKFLEEELEKLNGEQLDLLHYMEFRKLNAKEDYDAYRMMHEVQIRRRETKDLLEVVKTTNDKLKNKLPNISVFNSAVGDVRSIVNKYENRKYKPRVLYDIAYGENVRSDLMEKVNT